MEKYFCSKIQKFDTITSVPKQHIRINSKIISLFYCMYQSTHFLCRETNITKTWIWCRVNIQENLHQVSLQLRHSENKKKSHQPH